MGQNAEYKSIPWPGCFFFPEIPAEYSEDRIMNDKKKAVLVVSFGTSYEETRKKTIDQIENDMAEAFPSYAIYRAWTSGMIRAKLLKRDGIHIYNVCEALEAMAADGIREVVVQPTHVINGIENDQMKADVAAYADRFMRVSIGTPVLTTVEDSKYVIDAIVKELHPAKDEALVLMGHGTEHYADAVYAALDYQFKDLGHSNIFMGTVEGYPTLESVMRLVQKAGYRHVVLAPFMIVAGDHANNDLAGDEEDSWKSVFEAAGFSVRCVLKGLGEYADIRKLLLSHAEKAMEQV